MHPYRMWIGNKWVKAASGKTCTVINPATGEKNARIPAADGEDVDKAVRAANKAFPAWSKLPVAERCEFVRKIAKGLRENCHDLERLDILDHGTPAGIMPYVSVDSAGKLDCASDAVRTMMRDDIPALENITTYVRRQPVGVVSIVVSSNSSPIVVAEKLGIALAAGNTCILKPPVVDSRPALKFAEIIAQAGLPPGVVNMITGEEGPVSDTLSSHPGVHLKAYLGYCNNGSTIRTGTDRSVRRVPGQRGNKNHFIVFKDADMDAALKKAVMPHFLNAGMTSKRMDRFYIHKTLYYEFVQRFVEMTEKMIVVGAPTDEKTTMGPLVSGDLRDKVESYIKSGIEDGATLLLGGARPTDPSLNKGYYILPTVFADVKPHMRIFNEDSLGPVACFIRFSSDEEAITAANHNNFGLCASIWTSNIDKGIKYARQLRAETIWVNNYHPAYTFLPGGGFRESRYGRLGVVSRVEEFTRRKLIWLDSFNDTPPQFRWGMSQ